MTSTPSPGRWWRCWSPSRISSRTYTPVRSMSNMELTFERFSLFLSVKISSLNGWIFILLFHLTSVFGVVSSPLFATFSVLPLILFSNLPLNTYRSPARNSKKWVTLLKNENFHKYMLTKNNALFCLCTILRLLWTFCFRSGGWVRSCSGFPPRQRQASLQVSRTYLTFFHMYTIICNLSLKSYKFSKFSKT